MLVPQVIIPPTSLVFFFMYWGQTKISQTKFLFLLLWNPNLGLRCWRIKVTTSRSNKLLILSWCTVELFLLLLREILDLALEECRALARPTSPPRRQQLAQPPTLGSAYWKPALITWFDLFRDPSPWTEKLQVVPRVLFSQRIFSACLQECGWLTCPCPLGHRSQEDKDRALPQCGPSSGLTHSAVLDCLAWENKILPATSWRNRESKWWGWAEK